MTEKQEQTLKLYAESFLDSMREDMLDISKTYFRIGFRLAEAVEQGYYKTLGYEDIASLAEVEFDIRRSTTYGLMQVWRQFHNPNSRMEIAKEYEDFSYSQLLEIQKSRYDIRSLQGYISPKDSVRDIKGYIRFWNKYTERHSATPKETLSEWKENVRAQKELEENSQQLQIPSGTESEQSRQFGRQDGAVDLVEEVFEPDYVDEVDEIENDCEEIENETPEIENKEIEGSKWTEYDPYELVKGAAPWLKPDFKNREGIREFYRNYRSWEQIACPLFLQIYRYKFEIGVLYAVSGTFADILDNSNARQLTEMVRYYWQAKGDVRAFETTKLDLEKFIPLHKDEL